jgi:hypothetical protein
MKSRSLFLAALVPLVAISGANAETDEMAKPEMRVWTATLSMPDEEGMGAIVQITASKSAQGSNSLVIENVGIIGTKTSEGEDGTPMTEVMSDVSCGGPFMVEGGSFMVGAAPMEEGDAKMEDAGEAAAEACAFSVSGKVKHTYRAWYSWDFAGSVTMGESTVDFEISDEMPAMILEPAPEVEGEESEAAKAAS